MSTSGGHIVLKTPKGLKAHLVAQTTGGTIVNNLSSNKKVNRQSINEKINGGGPKVTLTTSGGNVVIIDTALMLR